MTIGKLTNSCAKSWGGGPTVNLIITSSLSKQYKEKHPFTVFQTALQNTLILSYLYQCDRIIPQQRINRKQNSFSFPVTHYLFCVCGTWSRSLRKFWDWVEFEGGVCVFARNSTCCGTSKVCDVMLVMSQCKIGIVLWDL